MSVASVYFLILILILIVLSECAENHAVQGGGGQRDYEVLYTENGAV